MVEEVELDSLVEKVNRTQTRKISPVIPGSKTLSALLVVKSQDVQYVNPYITGQRIVLIMNQIKIKRIN